MLVERLRADGALDRRENRGEGEDGRALDYSLIFLLLDWINRKKKRKKKNKKMESDRMRVRRKKEEEEVRGTQVRLPVFRAASSPLADDPFARSLWIASHSGWFNSVLRAVAFHVTQLLSFSCFSLSLLSTGSPLFPSSRKILQKLFVSLFSLFLYVVPSQFLPFRAPLFSLYCYSS